MERLPPEFVQAGARQQQASAPASITLEWLTAQCDQLERILRLQTDDGRLAPHAEAEIARYKPVNDTSAGMRLWAYLKHLFYVRSEGLERRDGEADEEKLEAARQLLGREPVVIQLCGRRVEVTGRSYAAMTEMAAHELRIRAIQDDVDSLAQAEARTRAELRGRWRKRAALRRRIHRLSAARLIALDAQLRHRRAFYAHALSRSGAPARDPAREAPRWWNRIGPEDHGRLVAALFEAGPVRGQRLGEPPPQEEGRPPAESFGALSLLVGWGIRTKVKPAALLHRDYGQVQAEIRAHPRPAADEVAQEIEDE